MRLDSDRFNRACVHVSWIRLDRATAIGRLEGGGERRESRLRSFFNDTPTLTPFDFDTSHSNPHRGLHAQYRGLTNGRPGTTELSGGLVDRIRFDCQRLVKFGRTQMGAAAT